MDRDGFEEGPGSIGADRPRHGIGEQCGPPPVVQYGDTISFNKPFYRSGESVEYKCPEYYILKGNRVVRCLNGVWDEAPVCLEPCTAKEKDMRDNNIRIRWILGRKIYLKHGDMIEFICPNGYQALPGTQMKVTCDQGKLEYPKCFKAGFCMLDQPTMITHKIHYNVSTIVDNGQTITFQCNEETIPENNLEAKCELGRIIYPKCIVPSPCKISTEDLNLHNIQLLPSNNSDNNPDITHRHGTRFSVTCKSGFRRPNQEALAIECYDGEFRYPRCFAGKICRIDQEEIDKNNLELDEVHDNEVYYEENERVYFKCKTGYYRKTRPIGKCSGEKLIYPSCTAQSSG
ncbi:coagulation factor XIII B chain-like isoform X2 [Hyla sarda]|uniref:coagulation factor XIII B chain-like isoform X2 n=1 Tax=Hyla sarda TaxID=327740 RepID=UPI0024C46C0E|nr:coagulation factor XIII B chain-like isoform X2 [Hyla sarda]